MKVEEKVRATITGGLCAGRIVKIKKKCCQMN
jgi:hypothetical protein